MDVAADEHRIGKFGRSDGIEDTLTSGRIAIPAVGPMTAYAVAIHLAQLRNQLALRENIPCYIGGLEFIEQPLLLIGAEPGALGVVPFRAAVRRDVAPPQGRDGARLLRAILATVEDRKVGQVAIPEP